MEAIHVIVIPTVTTTVPSTLVVPVATTVQVATTISTSTTAATTSATDSTTTTTHPSDEASKLVKVLQDMSIQTNEINRLKEQIKILEDDKKLVQIMHKNET